jgi:hypothetical protein
MIRNKRTVARSKTFLGTPCATPRTPLRAAVSGIGASCCPCEPKTEDHYRAMSLRVRVLSLVVHSRYVSIGLPCPMSPSRMLCIYSPLLKVGQEDDHLIRTSRSKRLIPRWFVRNRTSVNPSTADEALARLELSEQSSVHALRKRDGGEPQIPATFRLDPHQPPQALL